LLLHAIVHPADIQDRDGGILLLATLFGMYPFLKKLFADGGYQGAEFQKALARICRSLKLKSSTLRSRQRIYSVATPLGRGAHHCLAQPLSRLAKDWENSIARRWHSCASHQFRLMLRKLCILLDVPGRTLRRRWRGSKIPGPTAAPCVARCVLECCADGARRRVGISICDMEANDDPSPL